MSAPNAYSILKFWSATLMVVRRLKQGGAYFEVREIMHVKFPDFAVFSSQVTINNYHYDIYSCIFWK